MMNTTKWFAGACLLVLAGVTSVGAQEQLVPVMRIGNWIQVGGLPVAWVLQAQERLLRVVICLASARGTVQMASGMHGSACAGAASITRELMVTRTSVRHTNLTCKGLAAVIEEAVQSCAGSTLGDTRGRIFV